MKHLSRPSLNAHYSHLEGPEAGMPAASVTSKLVPSPDAFPPGPAAPAGR